MYRFQKAKRSIRIHIHRLPYQARRTLRYYTLFSNHASMADSSAAYDITVDGSDGGDGLRIDRTTTLAEVRHGFPVPDAFVFGVPVKMEQSVCAVDYSPLVLLNAHVCAVATLQIKPSLSKELEARIDSLSAHLAAMEAKHAEAASVHAEVVNARQLAEQRLAEALATVEKLQQSNLALATQQTRSLAKQELASRVAAQVASLRKEMATLRNNVDSLANDAREMFNGKLQMKIRDACFTNAERHAAELLRLREEHRKRLMPMQEVLGQTAEDLGRATEAQVAAQATIQARDAQIAELEARLATAALGQPAHASSVPARGSGFSEFVRLSSLKRDVSALAQAGRELHQSPESASSRDKFAMALSKLSTTTSRILDASGLDAPTPIDELQSWLGGEAVGAPFPPANPPSTSTLTSSSLRNGLRTTGRGTGLGGGLKGCGPLATQKARSLSSLSSMAPSMAATPAAAASPCRMPPCSGSSSGSTPFLTFGSVGSDAAMLPVARSRRSRLER